MLYGNYNVNYSIFNIIVIVVSLVCSMYMYLPSIHLFPSLFRVNPVLQAHCTDELTYNGSVVFGTVKQKWLQSPF